MAPYVFGISEEREPGESGIPSGKKVDDTIYIRGVANITEFHVQIKKIFCSVHCHRQGRSIGQMVNQGFNLAVVNRSWEYFFHIIS